MVTHLEDLFPGLRGTAFRATSPKDPVYNCIAWAAGETQKWWWPDLDAVKFWPSGIERAETREAFEKAFASLAGMVQQSGRKGDPGRKRCVCAPRNAIH